MNSADKRTAEASAVLFLFAALSLRISGFSTAAAVNFQNTLLRNAFLPSESTLSAIALVLEPFVLLLLSLVLLSLALAVLAAHGYHRDERRIAAIAGVAGAAIFIAVLGFGIASISLAAGVFIASYYTPQLANAYGKELKRWVRFRTGANAVGRALFFLNIIVALGIFAAVLADLNAYKTSFREDFTQSIVAAVGDAPGAENAVASAIDQSPFFASYFRWLPVATALGAWIILEFLRSILLANAAGAATHFMLREE